MHLHEHATVHPCLRPVCLRLPLSSFRVYDLKYLCKHWMLGSLKKHESSPSSWYRVISILTPYIGPTIIFFRVIGEGLRVPQATKIYKDKIFKRQRKFWGWVFHFVGHANEFFRYFKARGCIAWALSFPKNEKQTPQNFLRILKIFPL